MEENDSNSRHLVRLSISIVSVRNNEFYGRIVVKYDKALLKSGAPEQEMVVTSPPLELAKVHANEICFQNGLSYIEKPMDTTELMSLLNDKQLALEVIHKDKSSQERLVGTVTIAMSGLRDVKFVKTDDSYVRVHDSFYPIECPETGDRLGELRVKLFLEDFGPYDERMRNDLEKDEIIKNLTAKTDLELKAMSPTKRPFEIEENSPINFGELTRRAGDESGLGARQLEAERGGEVQNRDEAKGDRVYEQSR